MSRSLYIVKQQFKIHIDSVDTTLPLTNSLLHDDWYKGPFYPTLTPPFKRPTPQNSSRNMPPYPLMSYATIIWSWAIRSNPFDTCSNGFLIVSTTPLVHVQICYVQPRKYFCFNAFYFFCFEWFSHGSMLSTAPIHKPKFDIWHLRSFGATFCKHVFWLIPMCKYFPSDVEICMTLKCNIS